MLTLHMMVYLEGMAICRLLTQIILSEFCSNFSNKEKTSKETLWLIVGQELAEFQKSFYAKYLKQYNFP